MDGSISAEAGILLELPHNDISLGNFAFVKWVLEVDIQYW